MLLNSYFYLLTIERIYLQKTNYIQQEYSDMKIYLTRTIFGNDIKKYKITNNLRRMCMRTENENYKRKKAKKILRLIWKNK